MIKSTFYNLPYDKRQRIIDAVVKEFMERPSEKVSINHIIKEAQISRGSFYQYFDDKVDLIEIIAKTFFDKSCNQAKEILRLADGDLFAMYIKMFDHISSYRDQKQTRKIMENLVESFRANDDLVSEYMKNRFNLVPTINEIYLIVDRKNLKFKDDYSIKSLIEILSQILKNSVFNLFVAGQDYETVRCSMVRKIEIIKQGAVV